MRIRYSLLIRGCSLILILYIFMQKRFQSLGVVYSTFNESIFSGRTYFSLWCEDNYDALCVYQSLKLQEMVKIYSQLREKLAKTSKFYIFQRSKLKDCLQECQLRCIIKKERQKDKVWKKKQMMGLLHPVQTNLVVFALSNGEKVFTNPHLVERKYQRVIKDTIEMLSIDTEISLKDSDIHPFNKYK